jgi:hypothetical protein
VSGVLGLLGSAEVTASNLDLNLSVAKTTELATSPDWLLLIHEWQGKPQITDPNFLLSADNYSAKQELTATLNLYRLSPQAAFCRFPARIVWLARQQGIPSAELPVQACDKLATYQHAVPFEQLELVFATEVLSSSTSMMGHVFFKASGTNADGVSQAHTFAYFTKIETLNPLVLLYDNTIGGMQGYMVVRPFNVDLAFYRDKEQRTVWQFALPASAQQLELLQLHLYEIKDARIDYYFQAYNCATLTLELLALLNPDVMQQRDWIVTPADVVKAAQQHQLVDATDLVIAKPQQYRQLQRLLSTEQRGELDNLTIEPLTDQRLYQNAAAEQYARLVTNAQVEQGELSRSTQMALLQPWSADPSTAPDYTQQPHPARTLGDSLVSLSATTLGDFEGAQLRWLANGHLLHTNNQHYQAESELMMGNIVADYQQQQWQLTEFTLYSVTNLQASSELYPRWAGRFYFGYHPVWSADGFDSRTELSVGAGKSFAVTPDLTWYWIADVGAVTDFAEHQLFAAASTGMLWQLTQTQKLSASLQRNTGKAKQPSDYLQASFGWHWQWFDSMLLSLEVSRLRHDDVTEQQAAVQWAYFY